MVFCILSVCFIAGKSWVFLLVFMLLIMFIVNVMFLGVIFSEFGVKKEEFLVKNKMLKWLLLLRLFNKLLINNCEIVIGVLFIEFDIFMMKIYFCWGFLKGIFGWVGWIIDKKKFFFGFL